MRNGQKLRRKPQYIKRLLRLLPDAHEEVFVNPAVKRRHIKQALKRYAEDVYKLSA